MPTKVARIEIRNRTLHGIVSTRVYNVDGHDWGTAPGPQLNGKTIARGQSLSARLEVNRFASGCPFSMDFTFQDGAKDSFRVGMKSVSQGNSADFVPNCSPNHRMTVQNVSSDKMVIVTIEEVNAPTQTIDLQQDRNQKDLKIDGPYGISASIPF